MLTHAIGTALATALAGHSVKELYPDAVERIEDVGSDPVSLIADRYPAIAEARRWLEGRRVGISLATREGTFSGGHDAAL